VIRRVAIGGRVEVGAERPPVLIAGPCVLESEELALEIAAFLSGIAARLPLPVIFKGSFDKANRSSATPTGARGRRKGFGFSTRSGSASGLPVTTDVHDPVQARRVAPASTCCRSPRSFAADGSAGGAGETGWR